MCSIPSVKFSGCKIFRCFDVFVVVVLVGQEEERARISFSFLDGILGVVSKFFCLFQFFGGFRITATCREVLVSFQGFQAFFLFFVFVVQLGRSSGGRSCGGEGSSARSDFLNDKKCTLGAEVSARKRFG